MSPGDARERGAPGRFSPGDIARLRAYRDCMSFWWRSAGTLRWKLAWFWWRLTGDGRWCEKIIGEAYRTLRALGESDDV